jgi:protein SCO1/2
MNARPAGRALAMRSVDLRKPLVSRRQIVSILLLGPFLARTSIATSFNGKDVTNLNFEGKLDLTDHNGRQRRLADFKGKILLVFFGYTSCPEFCPTLLARLAMSMTLLQRDAARVQVLFVTLDPEHDTPALLRNYVSQFDARFLALRGTAAQTRAVADAFGVKYEKRRIGDEDFVDHSTSGFLIDADGKTRVKLYGDLTAEQITADTRAFL